MDKFILEIENLNKEIGIPTKLSECGVKESDISLMAPNAIKDISSITNPLQPITKEIVESVSFAVSDNINFSRPPWLEDTYDRSMPSGKFQQRLSDGTGVGSSSHTVSATPTTGLAAGAIAGGLGTIPPASPGVP